MYYGPDIMRQAGFGSDDDKTSILISSLPIFIVRVLSHIISIVLIDSLGRRRILMTTLPVLVLCMATVAVGMGFKNHTSEDRESLQVYGKWFV